jgi:hypothetical protein
MEHKRLPRGAKQVSQWVETSSEAYPKGYGEVTQCYYNADIAYPEGFVDPAVMVIVYDNGKQIYKQAFYGETADSDARRNANNATTKAIYATV